MRMNRSNRSNLSNHSKRITFGTFRSFGSPRTSSFTLIEILVAVGIIATIMVLVITLIVSIIHFNYKMSLQRQVNREARNIMEMIVREGRLARGATNATDPAQNMPAISVGRLDGSDWTDATTDIYARFREVPQLARIFGNNGGNLDLVTQNYSVGTSSYIEPADIMLVLDVTSSMLESVVGNSEVGCTLSAGGYNLASIVDSPSSSCDYAVTKMKASEKAAKNFVQILFDSAGDFRVGLMTYAASKPTSRDTGFLEPLTQLKDNLIYKQTLDTDIDERKGQWNTNIAQSLEAALQELAAKAIAGRKQAVVFMTDGYATSPWRDTGVILPPQYSYNYPASDCTPNYTENPPQTNPVPPTLACLFTPATCTSCNSYSRDLAWQIAKDNEPSPIQIYTVGFGESTDVMLLNEIARMGGTSEARVGGDIMGMFREIASQFTQTTYTERGVPLVTQTTSSSVFQLSNLNFTTNSSRSWVGVDMGMQTKYYGDPLIPSWQKAKIDLHTFFTTRSYP